MDRSQIEHLERRLQRERERALRSLGRFQEQSKLSRDAADSDLSSYSFHMADQGTDAMEREKAFLFASKEGRYLYRIEEALRRLYSDPENVRNLPQLQVPDPFRAAGRAPARQVLPRLQASEEEEAAA
jgi:RNA polymerase-binding transcription factor DksA